MYGQQHNQVRSDDVNMLFARAKTQFHTQEYKNAIVSLDTFIKTSQHAKNIQNEFNGYTLLGKVHLALKDTIKSREIFEKTQALAEVLNDKSLLAVSYSNLGKVYGQSLENQDKAITFLKKSIALSQEIDEEHKSLEAKINLSKTYLEDGNLEEAYPALLQAKYASLEDSLHLGYRSQVLTLMGQFYTLTEKNKLAIDALLESLDIAYSNGLITEELEVQKQLVKFYAATQDYEAAFFHSQRELELVNELYKKDRQREIQIATAQFDFDESARDLEIANKQKDLTDKAAAQSRKAAIAFIIATAILLIGLVIIYFMFQSRRKYILRLRERHGELIKAKDEAEQLSKLKTQFFSTISHELRTPLYGVIGIASILLEDKQIKTHRDDLKSLKFSADYLLALINEVLLMSKMEAKDITLENTPFKLDTLLRSITRSFEFSLEQNKNKLHLEIDPALPNHLIGDSVRLSQILMNLIGNAIKFNENGNIWVSIKRQAIEDDGFYKTEFVVKDDGIGIPQNSQLTIFEEFTQVENNNYNYQGTGLGLPIVKKLLALHGSDIKLHSKEGEGASFSFTIKLEKASSQQEDTISMREVLEEKSETIHMIDDAHILVVDDNKINQKITQKILEKKGFSCSLANDGVEAVEMAQHKRYDLILMDIHMPNKDGIEATEDIRKFDMFTPIVALTAVEIAEIRDKIQRAGMDDILVKPYDVSQFLNIILRTIKKKQKEFLKAQ